MGGFGSNSSSVTISQTASFMKIDFMGVSFFVRYLKQWILEAVGLVSLMAS